jgi:hypothetical protein
MSDSDRVQLAFIEESVFGQKETGSNLQVLRFTSESLHQESDHAQSGEVRDDRQVSDVIRTRVKAAGDIGLELSYNAYDDFMQAALMSAAWSSLVTVGPATTISATNSDNSFNDSANGFASIVANQWIEVRGFATEANNGYFKVVSAAAGKVVVSGGTLTDEAAGPSVTIKMGPQIVNGTNCPSFNIEKQYTDLSNEFAILTGMCIDQFNLNVAAGEIITGGFTFMGSSEESATASSGTGYDAATTKDVMSAVDDVENILENQATFDITAFSMQLQNNLRDRIQVGTAATISIGTGVLSITGTMQAYFESKAILDKFLNQTSSSLAILMEDTDGNAYILDLPRLKYTAGQRNAPGQSQDVIADMGFTAYRNPTEDVTIRIAKFDAA